MINVSENTYKSIFDSVNDGIAFLSPDTGSILDLNRSFCLMFDRTPEELKSLKIGDLISGEDTRGKRRAVQMIAKAADGEPQHSEWHVKDRNGRLFWVEMGFHLTVIEDKRMVMAIVHDVTERKRIEGELRENERQLNVILDSSPIPQFVIDKDHRVVHWNQALEKYSGIRARDIIGTPDHWKAFYSSKRPCLADFLLDVKEAELPKWYGDKYQKSRLLKDAYEAIDFFPGIGEGGKWLYFTATTIKDAEGKVIGAVETLEDITERKLAEQEVEDEKTRAELYLDLMSHDIKNYNQVASGYLELATGTLELASGERELLAKPIEAINASSRLIEDVVKLQKAAGKEAPKDQAIELCRIIDSVIANYSGIRDRQITIRFSPVPECVIRGNEFVRDVFSNLVGNAIKHSDPGKPLTIDIKVEHLTEGGEKYLKINVEDNGPGIPDDLKSRLFRRFERGETKTDGRGLGLYLVKTIVEDCKGKAWVEDRVSGDYRQGTRFVLLLRAGQR